MWALYGLGWSILKTAKVLHDKGTFYLSSHFMWAYLLSGLKQGLHLSLIPGTAGGPAGRGFYGE